mmetsp:Transcript_19178/g.30054  ORF Transcript_19178/g.30054 Transcript_19178/m.30054 type:complete len:200 (+) Transcript_19178:269-868(+)
MLYRATNQPHNSTDSPGSGLYAQTEHHAQGPEDGKHRRGERGGGVPHHQAHRLRAQPGVHGQREDPGGLRHRVHHRARGHLRGRLHGAGGHVVLRGHRLPDALERVPLPPDRDRAARPRAEGAAEAGQVLLLEPHLAADLQGGEDLHRQHPAAQALGPLGRPAGPGLPGAVLGPAPAPPQLPGPAAFGRLATPSDGRLC